jgi:hypothetical protein
VGRNVLMNNFFIDQTGFLCYKTTNSDLKKAEQIYENSYGKDNIINSKTVYHFKGGKMAGIIGEIAFAQYAGDRAIYVGDKTFSYDFLMQGKEKNRSFRIDIKTKFRSVIPSLNYDGSLFAYQYCNFFDTVDYYVFLSTITGYKYVWFCGFMQRGRYENDTHAKFWKEGDIDPSNGKAFIKSAWTMKYKYMHQFSIEEK